MVSDYDSKANLNVSTSSLLVSDMMLLERSLHEVESKISYFPKVKVSGSTCVRKAVRNGVASQRGLRIRCGIRI